MVVQSSWTSKKPFSIMKRDLLLLNEIERGVACWSLLQRCPNWQVMKKHKPEIAVQAVVLICSLIFGAFTIENVFNFLNCCLPLRPVVFISQCVVHYFSTSGSCQIRVMQEVKQASLEKHWDEVLHRLFRWIHDCKKVVFVVAVRWLK